MDDIFDDYIEKLNRRGIICPMPRFWARISSKILRASPELKDKREYQPLILGAWAHTLHKISEIYVKQRWFSNLEVFCGEILELKDDMLYKYR